MLLSLLVSLSVLASPPGHRGHGVPPGLAKKGGLPPGQAKKALPPGLARKFGRRPERPCIAFDPVRTDRAWFLINGRWELREGLKDLHLEIRDSLRLPPSPPPVPLPRVGVDLHVVLFD